MREALLLRESAVTLERRDAMPLETVRQGLHLPVAHPGARAMGKHECGYRVLRELPDHVS